MDASSITKLVIDGLVAFGTMAVAFLAIWGSWVQSKLAPPKLHISPHTPGGDLTFDSNSSRRIMYYHLKVVNERRWLPVRNCRVLLVALSKPGPDNRFHPVRMAVPLQFVWAPAERTPPMITLVNEQILDFGCVVEGDDKFAPVLYAFSNNFQGFVRVNEAVRFYLQIDATNFSSVKTQVFEVSWNGKWDHEPAKMSDYLRINEIKDLA